MSESGVDKRSYGRGTLRALAAAVLVAGFAVASVAQPANGQAAAPAMFEPPDGQILTGVDADQRGGDTVDGSKVKWDEWTTLMGGKPAALSHTFSGFDTWFGFDIDVAKARNATPLLTWQTGSTQPDTIAGAGATSTGKRTDQVLLQNSKLAADYGRPMFLRVDQEMNAPWFAWGPYDAQGQLKKEADGTVKFTPADYRQMWKRMEIVFRGGFVRDMNATLAAAGLPPLDPQVNYAGIEWMGLPSTSDPDSYIKPAANVAFVWNPLDRPGQPDVAGNRWADYYPGDEHVDWVGQTTYNTTWNSGTMDQRFAWLDAFYQEYSVNRGKPYMMGEWGLDPQPVTGPADSPEYINRMLEWTKSHPKVKALVYFSVLMSNGNDFRLTSYPEGAKALATGLKAERFLGDLTTIDSGPSFTVDTRDAQFSFSSPETAAGDKFECSLDGAGFSPCTSPVAYSGLADGSHVFKVRTTNGTVPGEPTVRSWNVTPPVVKEATTTSIATAATQVLYPAATTVSGKLVTQAGTPLAGKTVTVERMPVGSTAFSGVNTATTDVNGNWSMSSGSIPINSDYRARYAGDTTTEASVSSVVRIDSKVAISNSTATTDMKLGNTRNLYGHVNPNRAGKVVAMTLKKRNVGTIYSGKSLTLDSNSRWLFAFKPGSTGVYDVYVTYASTTQNVGNTSVVKSFRVIS